MDMSDRWRQLHKRIIDRKADLGLTNIGIVAKGGPSDSWLWALQNRTEPLSVRHKRALDAMDRALDWEPGTSWRFMRGATS